MQPIDHLEHDVKHADMSELDKDYFKAEVDMPNKGFQKLVSKLVLHSSNMVPSNAETLYHLDFAKKLIDLTEHKNPILRVLCKNMST